MKFNLIQNELMNSTDNKITSADKLSNLNKVFKPEAPETPYNYPISKLSEEQLIDLFDDFCDFIGCTFYDADAFIAAQGDDDFDPDGIIGDRAPFVMQDNSGTYYMTLPEMEVGLYEAYLDEEGDPDGFIHKGLVDNGVCNWYEI